MKEKKGWSVERIAKTAVLTAGILIVIAIVASMIFKNPIGANEINYKINFRRNSSDCCFYSCNVDLQGKKK